jgi:cytochrome c2
VTQDVQFERVFAAFNLETYRGIFSQSRWRTVATLVGIGFVLLVAVTAIPGNAIAAPDAKVLLKTKACGSCHIIPGVEGAYGKVGPTLKGLRERVRIVDGTMENNTKNLKAWLKNPKSIKSGTLMPNMGLTDDEIEIVIEYLNML